MGGGGGGLRRRDATTVRMVCHPRSVVQRLLGFTALIAAATAAIDREAVIRRHNVHASAIDSTAPLSVGNGEFAFTADVTGLQTLNETYTNPPLQTMSHWGWHRIPTALAGGVELSSYEYERVTVAGHTAHYATNCTATPAYSYLRANPHRINLGRVFLRRLRNTTAAAPTSSQPTGLESADRIVSSDLTAINQTLHLWNGSLSSAFTLDSEHVTVETVVHPTVDALAVKVCSALVQQRALGIGIAFPYPTTSFSGGTDWSLPTRHISSLVEEKQHSGGTLNHTLDKTTYFVRVRADSGTDGSTKAELLQGKSTHDWIIARAPATGTHDAAETDCLHATLWFTQQGAAGAAGGDLAVATPPLPPNTEQTFAASAEHWGKAWQSGAALDLSGSTAVGAAELERRVVLSQYIMMSQEAGSNPPQETALMTNSWYGKFHLEMRWHHQFHFLLWGRPALAQRSDRYFNSVREPARRFTSQMQGYRGVRWPKMVGPVDYMTWSADEADTSKPFFWYDGPSGAGPWILWQQPHPIVFAEMTYRQQPTSETIERYNQTIHDTADFMADFVLQAPPVPVVGPSSAARDRDQGDAQDETCYSLGPPMYTAEIESDEGRPAFVARDGTFELAYWSHGLALANQWRERLSLPPEPRWVQAERGLCKPLPRPFNGTGPLVYYPYSNSTVNEPFASGYAVQLFANAFVPGERHGVNTSVMAETVRQSLHALDITRLPWCSDPPLYAMSAARLGMIDLASEFLLQPNATPGGTMRYLSSGHCQIKGFLPVYTPGNGALLSAVAMLAGGWDGGPEDITARFPSGFKVLAEGFTRMF